MHIISILQVITSLGSAAFFLWAVYVVIQDFMYIHPEDKPGEDEHTRMTIKKSMLLTAGGIGMYFLSRICVNLPDMSAEYGIAVIALQSLLDTLFKVGFLLLLPLVLKIWRKAARKNTYH